MTETETVIEEATATDAMTVATVENVTNEGIMTTVVPGMTMTDVAVTGADAMMEEGAVRTEVKDAAEAVAVAAVVVETVVVAVVDAMEWAPQKGGPQRQKVPCRSHNAAARLLDGMSTRLVMSSTVPCKRNRLVIALHAFLVIPH